MSAFELQLKSNKPITKFINKIDVTLDEMIARLVSEDNIPFNKLKSKTFQKMLNVLYRENVPESANTFTKRFIEYATKIKSKLKASLTKLIEENNKFTLSFDEWKGGNRRKYLGILF